MQPYIPWVISDFFNIRKPEIIEVRRIAYSIFLGLGLKNEKFKK